MPSRYARVSWLNKHSFSKISAYQLQHKLASFMIRQEEYHKYDKDQVLLSFYPIMFW